MSKPTALDLQMVDPLPAPTRKYFDICQDKLGMVPNVLQAHAFDIDKLKLALPGIELTTAPEGYVKVHPNHHLWSKARIGLAREDGQFDVVFESEGLIEPDPFPKGYQ
mgnify:CR=1 FL=1